jgi:two-component system cell cycle sensor histidine kinase/response regulator CckA
MINPRSISVDTSMVEELRRALERSDARYEALVERAGYGIYRSSPEGQFLEANSILATMLGYESAAQLLDLDLRRDVYVDPEDRDRFRRRPTRPELREWVETRWKRRDGTPVTVRLTVRPTLNDLGEVEYYDGIVEDITERRRQDELLRRSERMAALGNTLAGVAHELNNPLAAIIGFSQLLMRKSWSAEDRAALETISHEAIRSAAIVKDLLALAGKRGVQRKIPTSLNEVVDHIVRTRRYALETAGIECVLELDPSVPMVCGDPAQLEQVVLNLVNNAEHALRPDVDAGNPSHAARLKIRTRHDEGDVVLDVEDNGPGVPAKDREHIWDPFWTTKEEGEGIGLGLSVVHGIVADHAGTIVLERGSTSGACFVIRLPAIGGSAYAECAGRSSRPLDVLVVDPDATDLAFVERFLTSRGHAVINAESSELALRLANQTTFDAVLCNARLVDHEGARIAAMLRNASGCERSRFVLSLAAPDEAPMDAIDGALLVHRPYDVEELRRLIEGD